MMADHLLPEQQLRLGPVPYGVPDSQLGLGATPGGQICGGGQPPPAALLLMLEMSLSGGH